MNDKKTNGTNNRQSPVLDFLSGHGSNPIAKNKRHTSNQLETTFINDVMQWRYKITLPLPFWGIHIS